MTGGKEQEMSSDYQVIIIGGGPAGLTAGLYCTRSRLNTLLIERGVIGGQVVNAEKVENYPGFPDGISGAELGQLMHRQATNYGLKVLIAEVLGLKVMDEYKFVNTTEGDFRAQAVIVASGRRCKLGVPGEDKFIGKGVSYCATCDAPLFRDKVIAVIGGGDIALNEALYLSKFASSVKVIHQGSKLHAAKILEERATAEPKIEFVRNTSVTEIDGDNTVKQLKLKKAKIAGISSLQVDGVFIADGLMPDTKYLEGILPLDKQGHIVTNEVMETAVAGILAAGDVRHNSARQAVTAAGDGATAALSAERFLSSR